MIGELPIRVLVLSGGSTTEHDVSLATGRTVARELRASGFDVFSCRIERDGSWTSPRSSGEATESDERLHPLDALTRMTDLRIDVVFNALHGPGGEDGSLQGLLRHVGMPFTGPDVLAAAVTMDKELTKRAFESAGIRTPRWSTLPHVSEAVEWSSWQIALERRVPLPWIVKPRTLGSSVGLEVFESPIPFLRRALDVARREWSPRRGHLGAIVEERIHGRELTCAVIETSDPPRALPPIEIRPLGTSVLFDYKAKYSEGGAEEICPAPLDAATTERVERLSIEVHRLFDCGPLSRTDLFLEPDGQLSVLEVNTLPGMTPTSLVPRAAAAAGIPLGDLLAELVHHALERGASVVPAGGRARALAAADPGAIATSLESRPSPRRVPQEAVSTT